MNPDERRRSVAHRGLAVAAFAAALGCAPTPRALPWDARIEDAALRGRVRALVATVREGGCGGTPAWTLTYRPSAPPAARPPELGPGLYGFEIVALDAACAGIARGCAETMLPVATGARVEVRLAAASVPATCPTTRCDDGLCEEDDAGPRTDAGRSDAGPRDAGLACPAGRRDCNFMAGDGCETTVSTLTDCGACGARCERARATATCTTGTCAVQACDAGWADCNGVDADGCEASLETTRDCGACGTACSLPHASSACSAAGCEIASCHAGWEDCNGVDADGCEASLASASSCGTCGTSCTGATPLCGVDGTGTRACVALCAAPAPVACGTSCVDTATAASDCGGCGTICSAPHASVGCAAGACVRSACDDGWQDCDGIAANGCERSTRTASDCGGCSSACTSASADTSCASGACVVETCMPGRLDCDSSGTNGCETDATAAASCGACGTSCSGATALCAPSAGGGFACTATCPTALPDACGGRCIVTDSDAANCGACGNACALPNASSICRGGVCRVQECDAGRADCNGIAEDGCEATLASDVEHCGACGMACPTGSGASPICTAGTCSLRCDAGRGDCDAMASTGCETPLNTATDCGRCGGTCAPPGGTGDCASGSCVLSGCSPNFDDCDGSPGNGCEVDLLTNRRNCGTCGVFCMGMTGSCCNGMCAAICP